MTQSEIAKRAYGIWEREGRPHGRDLDHWLAAERELQVGASPVASPGNKPAKARPAAAKKGATTRSRRPN